MNGVLKFLEKGSQSRHNQGIKCFPQKSVGVSMEAPKSFQLKNTLVNPEGYAWKQPITQPLFSQIRYLSVVGDRHTTNTFYQQHEKKLSQDKLKKKRGLNSQFLDKNSWQAPVVKMMGFQRSEEGRRLRNVDVEKAKQRRKQKSDEKSRSILQKSLDQSSYYATLPTNIEEKNRIRKKRNEIYDQEIELISQKHKFKRKIDPSQLNEYLKNKDDNTVFLRLRCPQTNPRRPLSQTYRTLDSWQCKTARTDLASNVKMRSTQQSIKFTNPRSTMDEFYNKEMEEFEGRFLKNGTFKKLRSKCSSQAKTQRQY